MISNSLKQSLLSLLLDAVGSFMTSRTMQLVPVGEYIFLGVSIEHLHAGPVVIQHEQLTSVHVERNWEPGIRLPKRITLISKG